MADSSSLRARLTVPPGPVDLTAHDPRATPGFGGKKSDGKAALADLGDPLSELQERLFAEGRSGGRRRVLLVLQGMDTSGKGGTVRHVAALLDPQGLRIKAFAAPTEEELRHDFLWRVRRELPGPGRIGVFDRSHYEDVLVARVHQAASEAEIAARYDAINAFERELVEGGTTVVKCLLHISPEEQKERLLARLDDPSKHWKFDPGDIDERACWGDYRAAYEIALERCSTEAAPWLVVPADRKWYRNWAIATVLLETLRELEPTWPEATFDVEQQRRRLTEHDPLG
ncbi:MAG TPA: polyphosphate kinase 2 family protein [Nocardioidaceae bacterium]|nr:polyphosphate kinase 2 family protein [Nocardioidaceae bacterium]